MATCTVVVRPGCATSLRAKGSLDLGVTGVTGELGSLTLLSHDTPLDAELKELKLCTLIVSVVLSLMFNRANFSTALSSSRLRSDEVGDEDEDGELDSWPDELESSGIENLFQGLSKSVSSLRYDVRRGSFLR